MTSQGSTDKPVPISPASDTGAEERLIPVADTGPDPVTGQPRKSFDEERDKELEASIREHGQLNAIIVYLSTVPPRYRLIAGERRWRVFRRLGRETIRARVLREVPDEAKRRELMLIDNDQRQDLEDIERGMAYREYMTRTGCTASALAQKLGKQHVSSVTRPIALILKLPEDVREAIGPQLPPSVAGLLTSLPDDDTKRHFAGLYREGKIKTGKELAAAIRAARNGQAAGGTAGFTVVEAGIRIACTWNSGGADAQALTAVENALRVVLKDLGGQKHRGLEHWKKFLEKKAKAVAAQNELAGLANPTPSAPPPTPKEG
jgi:ParB/RepB/Spo0J family partition protein